MIIEAIKGLRIKNLENIYLTFLHDHVRNTKIIELFAAQIKKIGCGEIASVCGRFYAMDRDKNWDRTMQCYNMLTTEDKAPSLTPKS